MTPTAPSSPDDSGSESNLRTYLGYIYELPPSPHEEMLDILFQQMPHGEKRPRAKSVAIMERCSCKEWEKLMI